MAASQHDIRRWCTLSVPEKATHMAVVCDTFDWEDYPVYIKEGEDAYKETEKYRRGDNMTQLMEVYDLRKDIEEQINQIRCFNY